MAQRPKPSTTAKPAKPAIELLSSTLERFSTSSRFPMLEHLAVSAFAKKDVKLPKSLVLQTFGDMVRDGGTIVSTARGVTAKHVALVIEILNSLLDGENSAEQPHVPSLEKKEPSSSRWKKQPQIRVSSVEAESKLTAALSKLRMSQRFTSIAMNRLGDYWDPNWVRAPFEEALTLEQLSQLKPQALLEKRSFTTQKLLHLVAAVEKAVGDAQVSEPALPVVPLSQNQPPFADTSTRPPISVDSWKRDAALLPATVSAAIVAYELEAKNCPANNMLTLRILAEIPAKITAREYISAALLEEYDPSVVSSMLKTDHGTVLETSKLAYKKLAQSLREIALGTHQAVSTMLSQPAAPLTLMSDVLFGTALSDVFRLSLTTIIARALGGAPVEAFGNRPVGYWSKNPQGLERAIRLLVSGLPKSDSDLRAESLTILPGLPFEIAADLLRPLAFFNDKTRTWAKRT